MATILKPVKDTGTRRTAALAVIITLAFVAAFGYTFIAGMNYQHGISEAKASAVNAAVQTAK